VHGWWNIAGAKMSKSLGNIVDPDLLADKYGPEALRYYLMSDITTGKDADFSEERLVTSYNSALANNLGNLLNRTLNMAEKFRPITAPRNLNINVDVVELETTSSTGTPETHLLPAGTAFHLTKLKSVVRQNKNEYASWLDRYQCQAALDCVSEIAQTCNETIQATAPWELAKSAKVGNPKSEKELSAVLYHLAESLRIIAILIWPVLPDAAHGIFDQLAWKLDEAGKDTRFRLADAVWGGLPDGHVLGKPVPLFPRIETPVPTAEK
jgi:methionyl-tRNA synthetase